MTLHLSTSFISIFFLVGSCLSERCDENRYKQLPTLASSSVAQKRHEHRVLESLVTARPNPSKTLMFILETITDSVVRLIRQCLRSSLSSKSCPLRDLLHYTPSYQGHKSVVNMSSILSVLPVQLPSRIWSNASRCMPCNL